MLVETYRSKVVAVEEGMQFLTGIGVRDDHELEEDGPPVGPTGIYVFGLPGSFILAVYCWYFDGRTGLFLRRNSAPGLGVLGFRGTPIVMSRKSAFWGRHDMGTVLHKLSVSAKDAVVTDEVSISRLGAINPPANTTFLSSFSPAFAIDDAEDVYLNGQGPIFSVFKWSTGVFKYSQSMPTNINQICLEDATRCYILMEDRTLFLFDYSRGDVLGVARVPPLDPKKDAGVRLAWDSVFRRLLMAEATKTPPTVSVRGFSLINAPKRITKPIPLKVPRQGRTIPVLVQVVDELNMGVGGYTVQAEVTGGASLVGVPITDHRGDARIMVKIRSTPGYYGGGIESPIDAGTFFHPQWVGPYYATGQYGNVDHPGNCEVLLRTTYGEMVRKRPCFADHPSASSVPDGKLLGVHVSALEGGFTDLDIDQAIEYAESRHVPVLVYSDTDDYPGWVAATYLNASNRIPLVKACPAAKLAGEPLVATPDEDVARIRQTVSDLAAIYPRVAIFHAYETQSDNYPLQHILDMQPGLFAIERDFQLYASLGFSRLRPSGMSDHPALLAAFVDECAAAVSGTPTPILLP